MKKVITHASHTVVHYRIYIAGLLLAAIGLCASVYTVLLLRMVYEGAQSRHLGTAMLSLSSQVNDLETEYLSLKSSITENRAAALGFSEARDVLFLSRKTLSTAFFIATDR